MLIQREDALIETNTVKLCSKEIVYDTSLPQVSYYLSIANKFHLKAKISSNTSVFLFVSLTFWGVN